MHSLGFGALYFDYNYYLLRLRAVIAVCLLKFSDFINNGKENIKAGMYCINIETLRKISPSMIVIGQNRILCGKGYGFYSGLCHRSAVAASDGIMYSAACFALNA